MHTAAPIGARVLRLGCGLGAKQRSAAVTNDVKIPVIRMKVSLFS
jgi:cyclopropane fatty-acyl-phospholipid synthase-like methyltransferase